MLIPTLQPARGLVGTLLLLGYLGIWGISPGAAQETVFPPALSLDELSQSFQSLSRSVRPAVVQVFITRYAPNLGSGASGVELFALQRGTGSGVLVDPGGYIVTNAHVVEGAERIRVLLQAPTRQLEGKQSILKPRGEILDATLVGLDSETDLAVIHIEAEGLSVLPLGDSDLLTPGQLVFAYGSPLGLETSVTMGVVSGIGRQLQPEDPMIYIQTDAAINPGNSGGPLVNTEGEIVGINTLILSQSGGAEGLGFAAPSNIVSHVYRQIRKHGRVPRGTIGATVQTITPELSRGLGLPEPTGVIVGDVIPGGGAALAGLQVGDVVMSLDGKGMENGRQFNVNLYQRAPGDEVTLLISRNQATRTLRIPVQERMGDAARFAGMVTMEENLIAPLGVLVLELSPSLKRFLPPLRQERGVLVAARAAGVQPWGSALEPGDVIVSINRRDVSGVADLKRILEESQTGTPLVLQVERSGRLRYLTLDLE